MPRDQRGGTHTTPLTTTQARAHLAKAEEYLAAAHTALGGGAYSAAGGTAVLAGINAADCVAGLLLGSRWNGPHEQAAAHINRAGEEGRAVAAQLRKLLRKKTQAHYETKALTAAEAELLVQAAARAVTTARLVAERQNPKR